MKIMQNKSRQSGKNRQASALVLIVLAVVILSVLGFGLLTIAYASRYEAVIVNNKITAMLAAEAGYEEAVFKMSQQPDMLQALNDPDFENSSDISFENTNCSYTITFDSFIGSRPIYKIVSNGQCGSAVRTCSVSVMQAIGGWESTHRVPSSPSESMPCFFVTGEELDIPIHVNKIADDPDKLDISISGSPDFRRRVSFGESRYTQGGVDKYEDVIQLFDEGSSFDQPESKISQEDVVQQKVERFKDTTKAEFIFTPVASAPVQKPHSAVQLEFFVDGGQGKVRITNNCTVRGYQDTSSNIYDYKINDSGGSDTYEKYDIYAYHLKPTEESPMTKLITDTYVTHEYGGVTSQEGGQIFINGNAIIGGEDLQQVINGKITVVATGNIWIADSVIVDGARQGDMPAADNTNILGLIAQGVVKVIDPGLSEDGDIDGGTPAETSGFTYVPVAQPDGAANSRKLPYNMEVEAAMTVGGGGWGAEHVGDRKDASWWGYDNLIVRGTIAEAVRGIVGSSGNGYKKRYYLDERLLQGLLPGDIWLKGKFLPPPAGWNDY